MHTDYHVKPHAFLGIEALAWRVVNGSDGYHVGAAVADTEERARELAELDLQRVERRAAQRAANADAIHADFKARCESAGLDPFTGLPVKRSAQ